MTVEPLSSNVVNYLVWRYLQEAGYGNAALQLSRSWIKDPESLPFARDVESHTLIHILQDGLWFDKLQAEVGEGQDRRYSFGRDHGTPYSLRNGAMLTLDPGVPPHQAQEEINGAVPETAPRKGPGKRKRKVNGIVGQRTDHQPNGDAMDIDHNGAPQMTHSVRAESEAVVSEVESPTVAEIPISTLSIGQSTEIQTEKIVDLAPETAFINIREPDQTVTHVLWSLPEVPLLLTAGKSLLRLYHIPNDTPTPTEPPNFDLHLPMNNFTVTALCWNSHDEATLAVRDEHVNEEGETMTTDKLIKVFDGGQDMRIISSVVGMVSTLRWNEAFQTLLSISTTDIAGSIKIWKDDDVTPAFTAFTDHAILDAAWMTNTSFVICGVDFFQIYEIDGELKSPQTLSMDGNRRIEGTWENIKYDAASGIIACAAFEDQLLGIIHPSDPNTLQTHQYPDEYFYDLAFQPPLKSPLSSSTSPQLLATCSGSGLIRLWDANKPFECLRRLIMDDDSPAQRVAFSPDGALLAAAGPDTVTVWSVEDGEYPMAPTAVWKGKDSAGEWDSTVEGEFSLSWNPDGKRLALGLGNQIAIINVPR